MKRRIEDGELLPGSRIPSEQALADEFGRPRPIVRMALNILRSNGLIDTRPGRGTYVREKPAVIVRRSDRYKRGAPGGLPTSPLWRDAVSAGRAPAFDPEPRTVTERASEQIAYRLQIEPGDPVMHTSYRWVADGQPVQLSESWEPMAIVGGTAAEEPETGPGAGLGVIARMDLIGVRIDTVWEGVRTRPSTVEERRQLAIPEDVWVIVIQRTYTAGEMPVETCDIVIAADRYELEYMIPID
nr:GntR family transcriptional regulator [Kineosporia babensis]